MRTENNPPFDRMRSTSPWLGPLNTVASKFFCHPSSERYGQKAQGFELFEEVEIPRRNTWTRIVRPLMQVRGLQ
jgi:hypothetical protein